MMKLDILTKVIDRKLTFYNEVTKKHNMDERKNSRKKYQLAKKKRNNDTKGKLLHLIYITLNKVKFLLKRKYFLIVIICFGW